MILRVSVLFLLGVLFVFADEPDTLAEKGVTFSHVYKIDLQKSPGCQLTVQAREDQAGELLGRPPDTVALEGEKDIVFKHNIRLNTPACDCENSESFKSLLYRINGLEEEVTYLKTQCSQGCCSRGGAGVDTTCSGHGTYQHDTCSCQCEPGWQGPDCSASACPDDCNDNGRCVDGRCACYEGYGGEDCGQLVCPGDCNDKGQCVDGVCVCFSHYTGEDCSVQRCPNDCGGNGRCVDGACVCQESFFGEDCSKVLGTKDLRLVRATDESLLVEWDHVTGAEYYVLSYYPEDDEGALQQVRVANTENSYLITGLTSGVTYIVRVSAIIKEISSEAERITAATAVSSVGGIRVLSQTEDTIQVVWQNPATEPDYFRLKHANPVGQEKEMTVLKSQEAKTMHTIIDLYPGTEYLITVQAIKGGFEGKASSVTGVTDLDAPTNLKTTEVTENTATVQWKRVLADVDGYMISYSSADGSSREIPVGADVTSYRLTGLKPGVVYTVYIWAVQGSRTSKKSYTQAETDLDAPTNLKTTEVTENTATVQWKRVLADVDGYMISYSSADSSSREIPVGADVTSYRLTGLKPGVVYTVYIWAVQGSRTSKKSYTQAETDLDAPTNLKTTEVTENTATVQWKRVLADVDGYMISYSSADSSSREIPVGADVTSYQLTGLKPGVVYTVYIWAVQGSRTSKKSYTQAETDIDAPTNFVPREVTESTVTMTWDRVQADVSGYMLGYSSPDGSSREIPLGADATSYKLTGLKPGVIYTTYIWAIKGSRISKKTLSEAETEIDAPTNLQASAVQLDSAVLTWKAPLAAIEGYVLSYKLEGDPRQAVEKLLKAGETRFSLSGLEMGKRYKVSLRAYRGAKRSRLVETTFITVGLAFPFPMDCTQMMKNGNISSGVYTIYVNNNVSRPMQVYCDMTTDGGGWVVFQRRTTGKLDFMKRWKQYAQGFGEMTDEFWLGLEKLHELTNTPQQYELRVDLRLASEAAYAVYDNFKIAPIKQKFVLTVGTYKGTAGDALTYHQGRPFSTMDADNDIALGNCALTHRGAWWYKNCHLANLNGKYGDNRHSVGINWEPWKGHLVSLDATEMKIRPVGFVSAALARKRRALGRGKRLSAKTL